MPVHKNICQIQVLLYLEQPSVNVVMLTTIIVVWLLYFNSNSYPFERTYGPHCSAINPTFRFTNSWNCARIYLSMHNLSIATKSYYYCCSSRFNASFFWSISCSCASNCAYSSSAQQPTSSSIITCYLGFAIVVSSLWTRFHSRHKPILYTRWAPCSKTTVMTTSTTPKPMKQ